MTLANAHKLLKCNHSSAFNNQVAIRHADPEATALRDARAKIRTEIRRNVKAFKDYGQDQRILLMEKRARDFRDIAINLPPLKVRFLTQGSYAYKTLIRIAQAGQEIDLDDGVYFRVPFLQGQPIFSSKGMFDIVKRALGPLVARNGWHWSQEEKDTCLRIHLPGLQAHIDLPLFAVDENEFDRIYTMYRGVFKDSISPLLTEDQLFKKAHNTYGFENDKIMLAHREKDWLASDPKKIHDWFESNVSIYGNVLRRICRYVKAWRDKNWIKSELTSLALMAMIVEAMNRLGDRPVDTRDDALLLEIVSELPVLIRTGQVGIPSLNMKFDRGWTSSQRDLFAQSFEALRDRLRRALEATKVDTIVVDYFNQALGPRIPNRPDWVDVSKAAQIEPILETKAATVAAPYVGSSTSG